MQLEPYYAGLPHDLRPDVPRNPVHIVLDNLRSAFNVGSIFRTSDAGAVGHIHLCGMTAYPPNDKLAKTALGAFDYVPWTYYRDTVQAVERLRAEGIPVVAAEVGDDAQSLYSFSWPRPVAVVFGHEVRGIRPEVLQRCDAKVCIPMHGYKNTINVATAFGIVLYEVLRAWQAVR
jgi:23S rRNA (guanosine2251-2'-O)-methyltransferase